MEDFETKKITYFKKPGKENTEKTIELAGDYAKKNDIKKIVVATYTGETALKVAEKIKDVNYLGLKPKAFLPDYLA